MTKLALRILDENGRIDCIFGTFWAYIHKRVLVIGHCCWVLHLVEAHQVADYLLVQICLTISLDQIHEDIDCPARLITEDLARGDIIGSDQVGRLVFLDFSQLGTSLLEFAIENVHESFVEAD